ncbi:vacuolar protein sorting-associated protein 37B [Contarinia nasturtii]|uniref:vacuolar protein sorting-associated protein 37B n=1 Tax=Contarinia nasturtii TaxID=265458 RepID=UPI0012D46488|nr:vacuolar protein sorting-associated protein 37B [Contarinia nasturtii]
MYQQFFAQAKSAISFLSSDELKALLNDDAKLEERVDSVLKILDQEKQVLIDQNRNIAEDNVNKEPEIIERKSRISEISDEGKSLCENLQEMLNALKQKNNNKTPDTALALLQAAAAECEEKSEEIASTFQNKEITIDEYLEQFMMERKLMHLRKLKIEKMVELMRPKSQSRNVAYPPPNFYPPFPMHISNQTFPHF